LGLKGASVPAATLLRPILDTYMDSAVAIVGCRSRGLERYSCEHDVLVVTSERRPRTSLKIGDNFADIVFLTERDVFKPLNPEHALSLAFAKPVRDTSLMLSTCSATNLAIVGESAKKASQTRLSSALKSLGRAEAAVSKGALVDADFWVLAASYEYAYAILLSSETLPSPSHLLSQLRDGSKQRPRGFEGVSIGAGLEAAGRAGCGARLEAVAVLHDLLREGTKTESQDSAWPTAKTGILLAKAQELIARAELAECYCFLGQELVDGMMSLFRLNPRRTLTSLTSGKDKLLGERLTRQLGLARPEKAVKTGLAILKDQVSQFARTP
jgi:hypothetical protein